MRGSDASVTPDAGFGIRLLDRSRTARPTGLLLAACGALDLAADVLGVHAQAAREDADVLGLQERVAEVGDDRRRRAERADTAFDGRQAEALHPLVQDELHHGGLRVEERADGAVAAREPEVARVESVGPDGDVGLRVEPLGVGEGAERGLLAGGIRVEREDHFARCGVVAHHAAEHRDVIAAERRAARRDRGRDAGEMARHDVGVPLDDDDLVAAGDVALREVEPVEHLGLLVDRRLGGVEVLGAVVVLEEPARAEAQHLPRDIADGPHDAAAEAVVDAPLSLRDEARRRSVRRSRSPAP